VNLPGLGLGLSIPFHPAPAKVSKIVILKLAKINQRKNKKMNKERGESLGVHCCHELGAIDRSMWTGHKMCAFDVNAIVKRSIYLCICMLSLNLYLSSWMLGNRACNGLPDFY